VHAPDAPTVVGWPGLTVPARVHIDALPSVVDADTRVGDLKVDLDGDSVDLPLRVAAPLKGPSAIWRLTHF
jgi:hypothetical protein